MARIEQGELTWLCMIYKEDMILLICLVIIRIIVMLVDR